MIEELSLWLRTLEWFPTLKTLHISGIALGLGGAIAGHVVAMRCLMHDGPSPRPGLIWSLHVLVIVGLCLLWASGTALVVSKFSFATLPPKVALKLVIATVLSFNALLMQEYLIPLGSKVSRPLVLNLSRGDVIKASLIGSTSLCCWLSIASVAFITPLHQLPLMQLFGLWLGFWACLAVGGVLLVMLKRRLGQRDPNQPKGGRSADNSMPSVPFGLPHSVAMDRRATTASSNIMALTERLKRFASASPVNDNLNQTSGQQVDQATAADEPAAYHAQTSDIDAPTKPGARELLSSLLRREPAEQVQASAAAQEDDKISSLRDVRRACRRALLGAATVSFFVNMLMLTGPLFMLQVYDRVLTSKSVPTLTALFGLVIGLFAFMGLLDFIRSRLLVRIGLRFDRMLAGQAFASAIRVGGGAGQEQRTQLYKDVQHIRQFVSGAGTIAIFDMPWAPIYLCVIALFHWALGMVALVGAALLVVLSILNEFFSRRPVAAAVEHGAKAERTFDAARRDRETLQAMGMTNRYQKRWLAEHNAEMIAQTKAADVAGLLSVITKTSRLLLQSAMLAMGAYLALGNAISPGVMIAASIIMARALAPVELAIAHWRGFIAARQGLLRLAKEFTASANTAERLTLPEPSGQLHVDNVFAAASGGREPVLKGLNFKLEPGDALGVLGPSGSGKSTLARILVGVWPTLRGHVCLDSAPLEQWPPEQLGRHIGYLPQNAELFDGTVAENIARFDPEASSDAIIAAARSANVHEMILGLSDGYNTRVGEGGAKLSGGQCQRLALARALFGDPALIVLDEPNSNLDTDGEAALAAAIKAVSDDGRTVVVMAHRRRALEHVSHILVLNDGRQSTFGTKGDVLRATAQAKSIGRKRSLHVAK